MKRLLCLLLPLFMLGCQEIETEMADIKSRLISLEGTAIASIQDQVSSIQKTIEALQEARTELGEEDTRLEDLITKLQTYVNESLSNETDWVKATYCTLEQYQAVSDEVATLGENRPSSPGWVKPSPAITTLPPWTPSCPRLPLRHLSRKKSAR